jgi:hypothetical protein
MNEENAKANIDCYFTISGRRLQVTKVDSFSGTLHYGFIAVDDGPFICGWIPVDLVGQCEYSA